MLDRQMRGPGIDLPHAPVIFVSRMTAMWPSPWRRRHGRSAIQRRWTPPRNSPSWRAVRMPMFKDDVSIHDYPPGRSARGVRVRLVRGGWVVVVVAVAFGAAFGIDSLRMRSDMARRSQTVLADIEAGANNLAAADWEAAASGGTPAGLIRTVPLRVRSALSLSSYGVWAAISGCLSRSTVRPSGTWLP